MEKFLRIGVITSSHGLGGEVKVYPTTDSSERFREVSEVILKTPSGDVETEIESVKFFKNLAIVKFAAFDSVEQVKGLHGTDVMIDRKYGQPLDEGEYYIADLIGCKVITDEGQTLGTVKDVLQTGANDVYVVESSDSQNADSAADNANAGGRSRMRQILLPVISDCVKNVDIESCVITVHIMPGLLDL